MLRDEDHAYQASVSDIYYGNRDLHLLLDYFCISSGVAPSLAILAAVDQVEIMNDSCFILTKTYHRVSGWH